MLKERLTQWMEDVLNTYEINNQLTIEMDTYRMILDVDRIIAEEFEIEAVLPENRYKENNMYTVAELIETLKQCPQDYEVRIGDSEQNLTNPIETVRIDHDNKSVDLFMI